jgi:DNA repair protein RecO (recombination protein O)
VPRAIVKTRAIVLRSRRLGETSKLVTLYTEDYGKLKVTAKGARKPRSKFGGALELMTEVQAVCYLREERELQVLSDCDVLCSHQRLAGDLPRLAFGSAACELIDLLTIESEPNGRLYRCLAGVLDALEEVGPEQLEPLFWYYQLRLVATLGYRPELAQCVVCRRVLEGRWLWFSAALGGGLCQTCGQAHGIRMAGDSLRFLRDLQALKAYRREAIPPVPPRYGEIRQVMRSFLEYHSGERGRLRALGFLESVGAGAELRVDGGADGPAGRRQEGSTTGEAYGR